VGGGGRVLVVVLLEVVEVVVGDRAVQVVVGDTVVEVVTGGRIVDVVIGGRVAVVVVTGLVVVVLEVLACPWQTAGPSPLQRPSVVFRHARKRPPAATHAAIASWHGRGQPRTHALWAPRGARENVDAEPPFARIGSWHSRSSSPAASTRRRSRCDGSQPVRGGLPCGRQGSPTSGRALARQNLEHSAN